MARSSTLRTGSTKSNREREYSTVDAKGIAEREALTTCQISSVKSVDDELKTDANDDISAASMDATTKPTSPGGLPRAHTPGKATGKAAGKAAGKG